MAAFDAPSREICTLRRISTNTPLQAFVTLNDPVYVEAAQALARRIVAEGGATHRGAGRLWLAAGAVAASGRAAGRSGWPSSTTASWNITEADATRPAKWPPIRWARSPAGHGRGRLAAWTVVANVILNLDGVLTKR